MARITTVQTPWTTQQKADRNKRNRAARLARRKNRKG